MIPLKFNSKEAEVLSCHWGFNCGPSALCAILGLHPNEIRQHMHHPKRGDRMKIVRFEDVKYTSPTMMFSTLENLLLPYRVSYRGDDPLRGEKPKFGLMRVQFGGPWCKEGVPMTARYKATHWVAVDGDDVYDINHEDGWSDYETWSKMVMPWIGHHIANCDKTWWPTHSIELDQPVKRERSIDRELLAQLESIMKPTPFKMLWPGSNKNDECPF